MRALIVVMLLLLAGCNGSSTPADVVTQAEMQQAIKQAIATQAASDASSLNAIKAEVGQLQLIGKLSNPGPYTSVEYRAMGEPNADAVTRAVSFGPCTSMGVMVGFTNADGSPADALSAVAQDFSQCTKYHYSSMVSDGSIRSAPILYWDGPNCTGNPIEWEAAGAGYNTSTLENGVVFASPADGTILMVKAGQTPQPILIQSVWVTRNPGCQADAETHLMYIVSQNDVSVSGVPSSAIGSYQLSSP